MAKGGDSGPLTAIVAQVLLFILLSGMAASVDPQMLKRSFRKWQGILVGLTSQFVLLPLLGMMATKLYDLDAAAGIALIATTASPGGAYSNWWCSMLNADLALSIAMTACSTCVCAILMPLNIIVYTKLAYHQSANLEWAKLLINVGVAVAAIACGSAIGAKFQGKQKTFNIVGNVAGVVLIIYSMVVTSSDEPIWNKPAKFYPAVATPCACGLVAALLISLNNPWLSRPEAVAVVVETTYQNTGLAMSIALATFDKSQRGRAVGVPLFYAAVQVVLLPLFLLTAWKLGLTYAPPSTPFCKVIAGNFQPSMDREDTAPDLEEQSPSALSNSSSFAEPRSCLELPVRLLPPLDMKDSDGRPKYMRRTTTDMLRADHPDIVRDIAIRKRSRSWPLPRQKKLQRCDFMGPAAGEQAKDVRPSGADDIDLHLNN